MREKIEMEFILKASPAIVYEFLTSPACIVRWFCDSVDIKGDDFFFGWNGFDEGAELVEDIESERLRFRWHEADEADEYLEFRMYKSPITGETVLEITDFSDDDEKDDTENLWNTQIEKLRKACGG